MKNSYFFKVTLISGSFSYVIAGNGEFLDEQSFLTAGEFFDFENFLFPHVDQFYFTDVSLSQRIDYFR
jgi:hypothetical protein